MKRTDYQKPTMRVVKLQHKYQIMTGSYTGVSANRNGYGTASTSDGTEETWE